AVDRSRLAAGAVGADQLEPGSVGTEQLASGAVDRSRLAAGAVGSEQLEACAVGTEHLAEGAVDRSRLAEGAVDRSRLELGAVGSEQLAEGAVGSRHLQSGSIALSSLNEDVLEHFRQLAEAGRQELAHELETWKARCQTMEDALARTEALCQKLQADVQDAAATLADAQARLAACRQTAHGIVPFAFGETDAEVELRIAFDRSFGEAAYSLAVSCDHPSCSVVIRRKEADCAILAVVRTRFGPPPSGSVDWIAAD
ncbi:WIAG-tail domain, partial [Paenibacillus pasadenensis]